MERELEESGLSVGTGNAAAMEPSHQISHSDPPFLSSPSCLPMLLPVNIIISSPVTPRLDSWTMSGRKKHWKIANPKLVGDQCTIFFDECYDICFLNICGKKTLIGENCIQSLKKYEFSHIALPTSWCGCDTSFMIINANNDWVYWRPRWWWWWSPIRSRSRESMPVSVTRLWHSYMNTALQ